MSAPGPSRRGNERGRGGNSGHRGRGYGGRPFWMKPAASPPVINESEIDYSLTENVQTGPYKGWHHYFPDEPYTSISQTVIKVKKCVKYFERQKDTISLKDLEDRKVHYLDVAVLLEDQTFVNDWLNFSEDLHENPQHTLNCLGLGLHHVVTNLDSDDNFDFPQIMIRLRNYKPIIPLKEVKASIFGKLTSIRGTVIRVGPSRLLCTRMGFVCSVCRKPQALTLKDGVYSTPKSCPGDDCRSKTFIPLHSSHLTKTKNFQKVKIQESIGDDSQSEGGRVPRTIEVEFLDDLVDKCCPGDNVIITGIVKVSTGEEAKKKNSPNLFTLFLEGVSVSNSKGSGGRMAQANLEFTLKDYYAIQELHEEENLFRLLINSLCPNVYGHELVKAGLMLAMFGGSSGGNNKRPLIHVLVVGDPGLGKSHMLSACTSVAPRGVYVCGNTTSSSGLTVTLTKESGGDFALEAGALVLANHGICCIDEFDKMTTQHQALLEAMEQERMSVAKGGVVCSLPAHSTILAAANPVGGHYNKAKSLVENLRMSAPLLSRFDLIYILLDKPNEQLDSLLSEHVMALHSGAKRKKMSTSMSYSSFLEENENATLKERLKFQPHEHYDLVPQQILRKYIAYARKYVPSPKLSPEAAELIQNFYLQLRSNKEKDGAPVTTRQLESMIRLTEARAKLELREVATAEDAADVIELMKSTLMDIYSDSAGMEGGGRKSQGGSQTSRAKRFIAALQRRSVLENKNTFSMDEMRDVTIALNLQVPDFLSFIATLNNQGFLLKKSSRTYQLLTV